MLKIAVAGVAGRMGRTLVQAITDHAKQDMVLSAAIQKPGSRLIGVDAGELSGVGTLGVSIVATLAEAEFDVLVDFTTVASTLSHLEFCKANGKPMVIGTTGFDHHQKGLLEQASQLIPIVFAANMSVGMNLCFHLLKQMSKVLAADSDIEIIEAHHRHKIDAPSGSALRLGEIIADTLGRNLDECASYARQGVGEPRDRDTIGFSTIRGGDIVGDHTVLFASEGERVELTHKASSRMTFAKGAIKAAEWVNGKPENFYSMQDVLGLGDLD